MSALPKDYQRVKDEVAIERESETPGRWILVVETAQSLTFQGEGQNGYNEFKHFLLPDIVAHIYFLMDKPELPLLHSKYKCRALLISWIGTKVQLRIQEIDRAVREMSFEDVFQPVYAHIITENVDKMCTTVNQLMRQTPGNPSFKYTLEPIENGFFVYTSKEKKPQPRIFTNVRQNCVRKQLSVYNNVTESEVQMSNFLFNNRTPARAPVPKAKEELVRMNPKLNEQVQELHDNIKKLTISQTADVHEKLSNAEFGTHPGVKVHYSILSDDLEDSEIDIIENLISSMEPPMRGIAVQKEMLKPKSENTTKSPLVGEAEMPRDAEAKQEVEEHDHGIEQRQASETEREVAKLRREVATLRAVSPKLVDKKFIKEHDALLSALDDLVKKEGRGNIKAAKSALNKAAMTFLIAEAGRRGVMKKDFTQTLASLQPFLPPDGENVIKRLIQGVNIQIQLSECISQVEAWSDLLEEFFERE